MNVLRVGVSPYSHLKPHCLTKSTTDDCDAGVELNILSTIAAIINLEIKLVISDVVGCGKTPSRDTNGTWIGLLKMLRDGDIDITGNLCDMDKYSHFDQGFFSMSWPVWQYQEQFVVQAPTPPPLKFAPFAPFDVNVWMAFFATCVVYSIFVTIYFYVGRDGSVRNLATQFLNAAAILSEACFGMRKHVPLLIIWPLWFLLLTFVFMFYNTYILSAVLHPLPIWRPFSNCDQLVEQLSSGQYRLLSYKMPPDVPLLCIGKAAEAKFNYAIKVHGYEHLPEATGFRLMSAIADRDPEFGPKLVLVQGAPFVSLHLGEYVDKRDRLWVIDETGTFGRWSGYLWSRNFTYAEQFNKHLSRIGDFREHALTRYSRPYGVQPRKGDRIVEPATRQAISLGKFRGLFLAHFGGVMIAKIVFLIEIDCARRRRHRIDIVLEFESVFEDSEF